MVDNNQNVYVDFDYQNIFVIDPNRIVDKDGNVRERSVNHEELVIYANLECDVLPRTKLAVGGGNEGITQISIAKINFLNPSDNNENTSSTNGVLDSKGTFRTRPKFLNVATGLEENVSSLLGITNISIKNNASFLSTITIELEDIRGRALFEQGDNSPYAAFFNLPYPLFYLTIKGYYGKAIRLPLMLQTFSARFNTGTGNFNVSLVFMTYKYTMISEITMAALNAVPHMYRSTLIQSSTQNNNNQSTTSPQSPVVLERGRQKITEVFSEYKSKGLIPDDFPEYTLWELFKKLELFEKNIESSFTKVKMTPLSDLDVYQTDLQQLNKEIFELSDSWYKKYLDTKNFIVDKKEIEEFGQKTNLKLYTIKEEYKDKQSEVETKLKEILTKFTEKLTQNPTLGQKIKFDIEFSDIKYEEKANPDPEKTYKEQKQTTTVPSTAVLESFIQDLSETIGVSIKTDSSGDLTPNSFLYTLTTYFTKLRQISKSLQIERERIEREISEELSKQLVSKENGIGFEPTIRNIMSIIFASGEAFLRLMDEVHRKAWEQSNNPIRKSAIIPASTDNVPSENGSSPVYPWPQFLVENTPSEGSNDKEIYSVRYPGEVDLISKTKADDYNAWPEVEFVEEFIYGQSQREKPVSDIGEGSNEISKVNRVSLNAIEFPITNQVYQNKEAVKFFYELWERLYLVSFYQRINRTDAIDLQIPQIIASAETNNIQIAIGNSSPYLQHIIKNYLIDDGNFLRVLQHFSNQGIGQSWQTLIREKFVTPYIKNDVNNASFSILGTSILTDGSLTNETTLPSVEVISDYINKSDRTNNFDFCDTYPFTDTSWVKNNLASAAIVPSIAMSEKVLTNTKDTIFFNKQINVFSNFDSTTTTNKVRPVTNFNYLSTDINAVTLPNPQNTTLKAFYLARTIKDQLPTEGSINYSSTNLDLEVKQSTSMLNTPIFVNSIQSGVREFQASNPYPFVSAAYLFINSLPLSTLREKYKSNSDSSGLSVKTDLDYIFYSFKKFGAVHKLPYAWILKYGSIWYRYKKYKETNVDIISNDWNNFNYIPNYDPVNSDPTRLYTFNYTDGSGLPTSAYIMLENNVSTPPFTSSVINTGFYPGIINDFNLFCQGVYNIQQYSNTGIQDAVDNGLYLIPGSPNFGASGSQINGGTGFTPTDINRTLFVNPWSCYVQVSGKTDEVFLLPSFGSNINQTYSECFSVSTDPVLMKKEVTGNTAMYNGSVRLFWGAPNYGYFDTTRITKPTPEEYLKEIFINQSQQDNFKLSSSYTDISEIFGVFNKGILDLFEEEFLKFSRSIYDFNPKTQEEGNYGNFQGLLRSLLKIQTPKGTSNPSVISDAQSKQIKNIVNTINGFMNYDVLFKYGNPSDFKRQIFYSFSNNIIQDPYEYQPYVSGTLPTTGGTVTLSTSRSINPNAWLAMDLYVGFSNITNLEYSDNGSYLTDFFVDFGIKFDETNVENLYPLIKIYGTQKLKNPSLTPDNFKELMDAYLSGNTQFQDEIITATFDLLRSKLPNSEERVDRRDIPVLNGEQTKVEYWETFKALNDKWIAGYDFTNKTLFEDVLFLDRASRNIGDQVYVDVFKIRELLYKVGDSKANMMAYVLTILQDNNFVVMNVPAYVNFYNVQDVSKNPTPRFENSLEFANTLFGTHTTLDLSQSSSKFVCFFAGKPSEHLSMSENKQIKFKDDSFSISRPSDNPLVESQVNKTDWGLSNRVVGFSVDVGVRNQNVFYNVQVDQNPGKATSESMQVLTDMANQAGNRKTTTQNQSLYNYYKTRSYTCTVSSFGNAMIQPTMYFSLKHVPMFNGTYFITDVSHNITPGRFETIFSGVRQSVSSLPQINNFVQTINQNLVSQIKLRLKSDLERGFNPQSNIKNLQDTTSKNIDGNFGSSVETDACSSGLTASFRQWVASASTSTTCDLNTAWKYLDANTPINKIKIISFVTMYVYSFKEFTQGSSGQFTSFNHNYSLVPLDVNWVGDIIKFFGDKKEYICVNIGENKYRPFASFKDVNTHMDFLINYWDFLGTPGLLSSINVDTLTRTLLNYYPDKLNQGLYNQLDSGTLQKYKNKVTGAVLVLKSLGVNI